MLLVMIMSTFLFTLLGLTVGTSLHCAVRREISPCTCRVQEPFSATTLVSCERMTSFSQVVDALQHRFSPETEISLKISYSQLDDISNRSFNELGLYVTNLGLNHDNLSMLPESVFSGLTRVNFLSLADNNLPAVPQHVLRQMPAIKTLDMGRSKLLAITDQDFQPIPELQNLILASNSIAQLEENSIPHNLRNLHLGRNQISDLNGTLRDLTELVWLFLNGNQLTTLDDQLPRAGIKQMLHVSNNRLQRLPVDLRNYVQLDSLFLQHNELQSLGGVLQRSKHLKRLHLDHNNLQELSEDEFLELEHLDDLQLGYNQLRALNGSLQVLKGLQYLNLTHNHLGEFSLQEIRGLQNIRLLDLSHNRIARLGGRMENMVELETRVVDLSLEYNLLQSLDGSLMGLHGLQRLNLGHNLLEKIAPDDLIGLENLRVLDISFNHLTTLEETSKTFLPRLEGLVASHNLLTALDRDFHGLPVLCWADLSHNKIDQVGHDLTSKTRCRVHGVYGTLRIYLQGNPVLCNANLTDTMKALEDNYTKIMGVSPCVARNITDPAIVE